MRSFIAALRSLVLPWGATSGARIVLDGVNGRILVYDSNGALAADIIPGFGFEVWDPSGNLRARFSSPLAGAYSAVQFWTGVLEETNQALITLSDFGTMNRLVIAPGEQSSKGGIEWTLTSAPNDDSQGAMLQAVCLTLNDAGDLRPIIDLTGASAPSEGVQPRTVIYDLWAGTPNGYGEAPTMLQSMGRGVVAYAQSTGNISIGAVASPSAYVDGQIASNVPVKAGRRYRLTASGWFDWVTGGSGWAIGDLFWFRIQVDEGAGYVPLTKEGFTQFRTNVAVVGRWAVPTLIGYYDATADGTPDFKFSAKKQAGATTVTMVVTENGGLQPGTLLIEDIGATP